MTRFSTRRRRPSPRKPEVGAGAGVFVAPDEPVEFLLLTLRNRTDREQIYRIAPVAKSCWPKRRRIRSARWRRRPTTAGARFLPQSAQ